MADPSSDGRPRAGIMEFDVEDAALEWLKNPGYKVVHGPGIAPHSAGAERTDYKKLFWSIGWSMRWIG